MSDTVSLREYVDQRFDERDLRDDQRAAAQERAVAAALAAAKEGVAVGLAAAEKAVLKSETAYDARFALLNESKAAMAEQAATYARRTEVDLLVAPIVQGLADVRAVLDQSKGRGAGLNAMWGYVAAVAGIAIAVAALLVR